MIYLTQTNHQSCGDVALRHLLMLAFRNEKYLLLNERLADNTSMYDLKIAAKKYGLTLSGYRINDVNSLKSIRLPCIALVSLNNKKHYIVISKYIFGKFIVYSGHSDPTSVNLGDPMFQHTFEILTIVSIDKSVNIPCQLIYLSFKSKFFNMLVHLMATLAFVSGLYLINVESRFEWPLSLFALGVILYLLEQTLINRSMRSFDVIAGKHLAKIVNRQDFFDLFQLKALSIKRPLAFLNCILIGAIASALLIIDQPQQLFAISFVITITFAYCYLDNRLTNKNIKRLNQAEADLLDSGQNNQEIFTRINRLSYLISHQKIVLKAIYLFLLATCSLTMSAFLGTVYLNFFLFEFGSLYLIGSQIQSLIESGDQRRQYYQLIYRFFIA
jgi:hypothetical protein